MASYALQRHLGQKLSIQSGKSNIDTVHNWELLHMNFFSQQNDANNFAKGKKFLFIDATGVKHFIKRSHLFP